MFSHFHEPNAKLPTCQGEPCNIVKQHIYKWARSNPASRNETCDMRELGRQVGEVMSMCFARDYERFKDALPQNCPYVDQCCELAHKTPGPIRQPQQPLEPEAPAATEFIDGIFDVIKLPLD